jgi:hypothetical protein
LDIFKEIKWREQQQQLKPILPFLDMEINIRKFGGLSGILIHSFVGCMH